MDEVSSRRHFMVGPLEKPGTSLKAGHYKLYRSPLYCLHPLYWPTFRSVLLFASPTYRWPFRRPLRPERIYGASPPARCNALRAKNCKK
jgi:hypothetical protein